MIALGRHREEALFARSVPAADYKPLNRLTAEREVWNTHQYLLARYLARKPGEEAR
jgi:hypothetical protein